MKDYLVCLIEFFQYHSVKGLTTEEIIKLWDEFCSKYEREYKEKNNGL